MMYIKLTTMEYPLHEGNIRLEHPEILETQTGSTFPLPPEYAIVEQPDPPTPPAGFKVECTPPLFNGKKWSIGWRFIPKIEEDYRWDVKLADSEENRFIKAEKSRAERIMQFSSNPTDKADAKTYFDALDAYFESYPRSGVLPQRIKTLSNGNQVTVDSSGGAPNVIG
jgi:hypothetical protein